MKPHTHRRSIYFASALLLLGVTRAAAQEPGTEISSVDSDGHEGPPRSVKDSVDRARTTSFTGMSLEKLLHLRDVQGQPGVALYGYMRTNAEQVFDVPSRDVAGRTIYESDPFEWSPLTFHLFGTASITEEVSVLFNIAGSEDGVEIRNAYGNLAPRQWLQFRFGKMYRRFGLYNEKLDQIPTILGIEPPELFDRDHLMVPRTTAFAVHGRVETGERTEFTYFLDTEYPLRKEAFFPAELKVATPST